LRRIGNERGMGFLRQQELGIICPDILRTMMQSARKAEHCFSPQLKCGRKRKLCRKHAFNAI
jgi:hypothetical protein